MRVAEVGGCRPAGIDRGRYWCVGSVHPTESVQWQLNGPSKVVFRVRGDFSPKVLSGPFLTLPTISLVYLDRFFFVLYSSDPGSLSNVPTSPVDFCHVDVTVDDRSPPYRNVC